MRNWMLLCLTSFPLLAGQVTIEDVVVTPGASRSWNVAVTLSH
ncbi:hypothetical protein [Aliagarivorans taiwanensis]|nr:hypothetical protein [Aliagarivorans taiwanensis]